jgi:uncharacterized protein (TIGR03790 family)
MWTTTSTKSVKIQLSPSYPLRLSATNFRGSPSSSISSATLRICRALVPVAITKKSVTGEIPRTSSTVTLWHRVAAAKRAASMANCMAPSLRTGGFSVLVFLAISHLHCSGDDSGVGSREEQEGDRISAASGRRGGSLASRLTNDYRFISHHGNIRRVIFSTPARRVLLLIAILVCLARIPAASALQPDEIALIINSNVPQGRDLAQFYAQARHIPDNRILELDLPKGDDISFKDYEQTVVPQVREFLRTGELIQQVKCFVTFYGVPLRIDARVNTPDESREQADLRQELLHSATAAQAPVKALEDMARRVDPNFQPGIGNDLDHLVARARDAERSIISVIQAKPTATDRAQLGMELYTTLQPLAGDAMAVKRLALVQAMKASTQPTTDVSPVITAKNAYDQYTETAAELEQSRFDPKARRNLRKLVSEHFGLFSYVKLLRDQVNYLETRDTGSAFDNELALVKWSAYSPVRWQENPLHYAARKPLGSQPPTYMVMRLDAPKPEMVKDIITSSIEAELHGLQGKVVLDSRGLDPQNPKDRGLADYDQSIRDLGDLVRNHTKLDLLEDDKPELLPPHSADHVAIYCGWYSVHNYVPCCTFNPGAVGFHIASFEMLSLHNPADPGWVTQLLNNGVAATLGPVAEPFVQAFPQADDFFPLLFTGKLSLAEVYWKTTPMASWMIGAVGDPLYTPYKTNPALDVKDLPERLRNAVP